MNLTERQGLNSLLLEEIKIKQKQTADLPFNSLVPDDVQEHHGFSSLLPLMTSQDVQNLYVFLKVQEYRARETFSAAGLNGLNRFPVTPILFEDKENIASFTEVCCDQYSLPIKKWQYE